MAIFSDLFSKLSHKKLYLVIVSNPFDHSFWEDFLNLFDNLMEGLFFCLLLNDIIFSYSS